MFSNEPTAADYAASSANDAQRMAKDNRAYLDWLAKRIERIETFLVLDAPEPFEFPSDIEQRRYRENAPANSIAQRAFIEGMSQAQRQYLGYDLGGGLLGGKPAKGKSE